MVDIKVRNFLGLEFGDITGLTNIALIGGRNFQGKSSFLEATAGVLCNVPMVRGIKLKKELKELVSDGVDTAEAFIRVDDNAAKMTWPTAEYESEGVPPHALPFACGAAHISGLTEDQRRLVLIQVLQAMPTRKDVERFLKDAPGIPPAQVDQVIATVWDTVQTNGWDVYAKDLQEKGVKLKGNWEEVTGTKFGAKKAAEWSPEGWSDDLAGADQEELRGNVTSARAILEEKIGGLGTDIGRMEELQRVAGQADELKENITKLEAAKAKWERQLEKRSAELADLPPYHRVEPKPCPGCGIPLVPAWGVNLPGANTFVSADEYDLVEAENFGRSKEKLAERTAARDAIVIDQGKIQREISEVNRLIVEAQTKLQAAEKAQKDLDKIESSKVTQEDVEHARERVEQHERVYRLFAAKAKAAQIFATIKINLAAQSCVKQEGCRHTVLRRKLEELNDRLADLCEQGGFKRRVQIGMDLVIRLGERRYGLMSGSERMLTDTVLMVAIGIITKAPLLLVDELETLEKQWRPVVLKILRYASIPSVVVTMADDKASVPNMKAFGLGRNFWIENGQMEELRFGD